MLICARGLPLLAPLPPVRIWIESEHAIAFAPAVDGHILVVLSMGFVPVPHTALHVVPRRAGKDVVLPQYSEWTARLDNPAEGLLGADWMIRS